MILKPDYQHNNLAVTNAILRHYGVDCGARPAEETAEEALKENKKSVIYLLFDGMGINLLEKHLPENAFLRRQTVKTLTSVYPPTTVAATTSVETGLNPIEHGWLGWFLYFEEAGENVTAFGSRRESNYEPYGENLARKHMPLTTVFERIHEVSPEVKNYFFSPFSDEVSERVDCVRCEKPGSVHGLCRSILKLNKREEKQFIYSYWPNPDHFCHEFGIDNAIVRKTIRAINREAEALCRKLKDATVFIIADHSLINVEFVYLEDYPALREKISRVSLENRTVSIWVKEGEREAFAALFKETFGDDFVLMTHREFLESGLLGSGTPHPMVESFIGDFVALAVTPKSLALNRENKPMLGAHAGYTKEEAEIPLVLVQK